MVSFDDFPVSRSSLIDSAQQHRAHLFSLMVEERGDDKVPIEGALPL